MTFSEVLKHAETVVVEYWNEREEKPEIRILKNKKRSLIGDTKFLYTTIDCLNDDDAISYNIIIREKNIWITVPQPLIAEAYSILAPDFSEFLDIWSKVCSNKIGD